MIKQTLLWLACAPLAACAPVPPGVTPPPVGNGRECDAQPANDLVGQTASAETGARALALSGAGRLRWGPPRSAFTMDYRADRVNVMYDDTMKITQVTCG